MIWLLTFVLGAAYAVYRVNKFADDVNPYNFVSRDNK